MIINDVSDRDIHLPELKFGPEIQQTNDQKDSVGIEDMISYDSNKFNEQIKNESDVDNMHAIQSYDVNDQQLFNKNNDHSDFEEEKQSQSKDFALISFDHGIFEFYSNKIIDAHKDNPDEQRKSLIFKKPSGLESYDEIVSQYICNILDSN